MIDEATLTRLLQYCGNPHKPLVCVDPDVLSGIIADLRKYRSEAVAAQVALSILESMTNDAARQTPPR